MAERDVGSANDLRRERIPELGALLVSVSRGSAFTDVPSVAGLASRDAQSLLERTGFVPTKRYAPSTQIDAWHALQTDPVAGTRVKRPAHVPADSTRAGMLGKSAYHSSDVS